MWPTDEASLVAAQHQLAQTSPDLWTPPDEEVRLGGCWVSFARGLSGPGAAGDRAWAAAVTTDGGRVVASHLLDGEASAPYQPGLLALRLGRLMETAVRGLRRAPDVLLLDASGRDHPRRAGLALHLGAVTGLPTVGVTHRPLLAEGGWPEDRRGATTPLLLGDEVVASWVRTRPGVRPLVVHPGWRVDLPVAVELVLRASRSARTPEPLRRARHMARQARSRAS